jgi:uncharacterized cupredoxin-like copper-binding protein
MKTLLPIIVVSAISVGMVQAQTAGEKASEAWDQTKQTAKETGHAVVKTTKKAANAVADALTPEPDARKINVTVAEDRIDMPTSLEPGKTAFIVKNDGKEKHNFEVKGDGTDRKFITDLTPKQTKVLHVNLKRGTYTVYCPVGDNQKKGMETSLTVR